VILDAVPAQNLPDDLRYRELLIDRRVRDSLEPSEMRFQDDFVPDIVLRGLHRRERSMYPENFFTAPSSATTEKQASRFR
jgi:hypothetical protein